MTAFPGRAVTFHAVGSVERGHWTSRFTRVDLAPQQNTARPVRAIQFNDIRAGEGVRVRLSALAGTVLQTERPIATITVLPGQHHALNALTSTCCR